MDNMFKKQMLISRSKLKDLLPTVTDEQLDNLYKTQDGKARPVVGTQTVISTLGLKDRQKTIVEGFRNNSKQPVTRTTGTTGGITAIKDFTDSKLLKNIRGINAKIKDLQDQITKLEAERKTYEDEIERRKTES